MLDHVDTYIASILCSSWEVWGCCKGNEVERLQLLRIKRSTCNASSNPVARFMSDKKKKVGQRIVTDMPREDR